MGGPKNLYKIKNKVTNEYSKGGIEPKFGKVGKIWKHPGHLKNHLMQFKEIPDTWEIEVYHIEVDPHHCSAKDFLKDNESWNK